MADVLNLLGLGDDEVEEEKELTDIISSQREEMLLRIRREGLTRLEFDANNELVPSLENLRILGIEAEQKKSSLVRQDVLDKLQGYRLLTNKLNTNTRRWTRYIDVNDGFLRAGGFPIRNEPNEEFIVMKNVSKRFTFSINRRNVILMEKIPKNATDLISDDGKALIRDFRNRSGSGTNFVALNTDFSEVHRENNNTALARTIGVNRGALGRKFNSNAGQHKNWLLFKLSLGDFNDLNDMIPLADAILQGIPDNLQAVIDRFYPEDIDISILDTDTESELSELLEGDDFLADLLGEIIEEEENVEEQILDVMIAMAEDPRLDNRVRTLIKQIHPQDTRTGQEAIDMLRILKKIQSRELLEREEGAFLKVLRTRKTNREETAEDERIIRILRIGEARGIEPIDNPELADVDLGTIIRLSFTIERDEEKEAIVEQALLEQFQEITQVDIQGRELLTPNTLEWWINEVMTIRLGDVFDSKGIKVLLDAKQDEIGKTFAVNSISRSANKLAEKRYVLKVGGKYVKAV